VIADKDDPRRLAIVQYQREAVDVLYGWAAQSQVREVPSTKLVPSEPIVEPTSRHDLQRALHRLQGPALPGTRLQLNGCRLSDGF
jgi:hypothetical protein